MSERTEDPERDEEEPQPIPLRKYIRHLKNASLQIDQTIQGMNRKISELLQQQTKIKTDLGGFYGTNCGKCKVIIPFSGHGKRPLFCSTCKKIRRREFCKTWRRQHPNQVRDYMRRYRQRSKHFRPLADDEPNMGAM